MATRKSWFPFIVDLPSDVRAVYKAFRMCVSWWLTQLCTRYTHENWEVHHFPVFSPRLQFYYFKIKQHSITWPLKSLTFFPWTPKRSITSLQLPHSFMPSGPWAVIYMSCFLQSYYTINRGQPSPVGPFWGTFLGTWFFLLIWRVPPSDRL